MIRMLAVLVAAGALAWPGDAQDKKTDEKSTELPPVKKTGRPGELTPEEEDKLDMIVDAFIKFDTGQSRDSKALLELNRLGPEAIGALIRGLNKSINNGHSCPVGVISKKLNQLISISEDPAVMDFIKENVGAGVKNSQYDGVLNNLKLTAIYKKRQIVAAQKTTTKPADTTKSPGSKPPGSPGEEKPPQ